MVTVLGSPYKISFAGTCAPLINLKMSTIIKDFSTVTSYFAFGKSLEGILRTCNLTEELVSLRPVPFYQSQIIERLRFRIEFRRYPVQVWTLEPAIQCEMVMFLHSPSRAIP